MNLTKIDPGFQLALVINKDFEFGGSWPMSGWVHYEAPLTDKQRQFLEHNGVERFRPSGQAPDRQFVSGAFTREQLDALSEQDWVIWLKKSVGYAHCSA